MIYDIAMVSETLSSSISKDRSTKNHSRFRGFIGTSKAMQEVYEKIENAAPSDSSVFITGEPGTGKRVCAEAIHLLSTRADKPFIKISCASIPFKHMESVLFGHQNGPLSEANPDYAGAIEQAEGGTLFIDEITEMNLDTQSKLLHFLQDFTFYKTGSGHKEKSDVRMICTTNRDPLSEIAKGLFREDLYYRLHVIPISMPPLRKRGEDALDIALALLRQYGEEEGKSFKSFSEDAEYLLKSYSWPGNIHELQNVIKNVVLMNDQEIVGVDLLPSMIRKQSSFSVRPMEAANRSLSVVAGTDMSLNSKLIRPLLETEREAIENAIFYCDGNIPRAAALLEVAPSTIYRKKSQWDKHGSDR